jgi:uncharacterized protein (DUF1697 family)
MPDLRATFAAAGLGEARTYLQSGNVVLGADEPPEVLAELTERLIAERFGLTVPVVGRTRDELHAVIERDPFAGGQLVEKLYQVSFLADDPPNGLADEMAALAVGDERFVAHGREWYVYHPAGVARSKLATRIAAKNLGVLATARNWVTVRNLLAIADEL